MYVQYRAEVGSKDDAAASWFDDFERSPMFLLADKFCDMMDRMYVTAWRLLLIGFKISTTACFAPRIGLDQFP